MVIDATGDYEFGVKTENGFQLWINGKDRPLIDGYVAAIVTGVLALVLVQAIGIFGLIIAGLIGVAATCAAGRNRSVPS